MMCIVLNACDNSVGRPVPMAFLTCHDANLGNSCATSTVDLGATVWAVWGVAEWRLSGWLTFDQRGKNEKTGCIMN